MEEAYKGVHQEFFKLGRARRSGERNPAVGSRWQKCTSRSWSKVEAEAKFDISVQYLTFTSTKVRIYWVQMWILQWVGWLICLWYCCCSYEWLKNGEPIWIGSNFLPLEEGSFRIIALRWMDEGIYQCLAFNAYGAAVSQNALLQPADLNVYSTGRYNRTVRTREGVPFVIPCRPRASFPAPSFSWSLIVEPFVGYHDTPVHLSRRIQMDDQGCSFACTKVEPFGFGAVVLATRFPFLPKMLAWTFTLYTQAGSY